MKEITNLIEQVEIKGPMNKGTNDFYVHIYTVDGQEFVRFSQSEEAEFAEGDYVYITYETTKNSKGTSNKIITMAIDNDDEPTPPKKTAAKTVSTAKARVDNQAQSKGKPMTKPVATPYGKSPQESQKIARMNAFTSALKVLELESEQDGMSRQELVNDAIAIADEIVAYTTAVA